MTRYVLKHKNINVLNFIIEGLEIKEVIINKETIKYLPLPMKRIIHNKNEFINKEDKESYMLNEEGIYLFDNWLSDREIPITRENYKDYIKRGSNPRKWLIENNGISITDTYWLKENNSELRWKDIYIRIQNIDKLENVKDGNNHYKGINSTLGGQLEKFWYRQDGILKLCKKTEPLFDCLNARELIASLIYEKQGFDNYCKYDYIYNSQGNPIGVTCEAFTNENVELITSFDLLEEYNLTQQNEIYELIPELANKYGIEKQKIFDYLDIQTMVDFLILNRDRHQGNIGFLRNSETLEIISPAPIFDSGSCRILEADNTESLLRTKVNGLYNTDGECLSHVRNSGLLNLSKLPSREELKEIMDKCINMSEERKEKLLNLYDKKRDYLYDYQRSQKIDYRIPMKVLDVINMDDELGMYNL